MSDMKVALVTPYFPFFDGVFPDDYRTKQHRNAERLAALLVDAGIDVLHHGLVDSGEQAAELSTVIGDWAPEVLVIAPVMAAPATHSLAVAKAAGVPVIVLQVLRRDDFPDDYDEVSATEDSTFLGAAMICSGLRHEGIDHHQVMCSESDIEIAIRAISGAAAAGRLRGRRIGVIGDPVKGYVDVELGDQELSHLGVERVAVPSRRVIEAFQSVSDGQIRDVRADLEGQGTEIMVEDIERDLRLGVALDQISEQSGLDAVALNCHDTTFRRGSEIGIPACLAGTVLASGGRPTTCTGDVSTLIPLLLARQFTDRVVYCEPYTWAPGSGSVVLGSCGIGTISSADARRPPRVCENEAYPGDIAAGACIRFSVASGPGTMIAHVPGIKGSGDPGRLIWLSGEITNQHFEGLHGPHAILKPDAEDLSIAMGAWASAGPAHHVALVAADLSLELASLAHFSHLPIQRIV